MQEPNYTLLSYARFLTMVNVKSLNDCWEWLGTRHSEGYGLFKYGGERTAHRASWALHHGPIPAGKWVLHSCDNPPCVNPAHLRLGTAFDNIRDRVSRGRSAKFGPEEHRKRWPHLWSEDGQRRITAAEGRARLSHLQSR